MKLSKLLAVAAVFTMMLLPVRAEAASTHSKRVDCTVYVYKPSRFLGWGYWRPKTFPTGWTMRDWFDYCYDRFKVKKQDHGGSNGPWDVTITLNVRNCSYVAPGIGWLNDPAGWRKANIHIDPFTK